MSEYINGFMHADGGEPWSAGPDRAHEPGRLSIHPNWKAVRVMPTDDYASLQRGLTRHEREP